MNLQIKNRPLRRLLLEEKDNRAQSPANQPARHQPPADDTEHHLPSDRFLKRTTALPPRHSERSQESHLAFVYDDDHAAWYSTFYRIDSSPPTRMPSRSLESRMLAKLLKERAVYLFPALTRSNLVFCARPLVRRLVGRGRIEGWDMS